VRLIVEKLGQEKKRESPTQNDSPTWVGGYIARVPSGRAGGVSGVGEPSAGRAGGASGVGAPSAGRAGGASGVGAPSVGRTGGASGVGALLVCFLSVRLEERVSGVGAPEHDIEQAGDDEEEADAGTSDCDSPGDEAEHIETGNDEEGIGRKMTASPEQEAGVAACGPAKLDDSLDRLCGFVPGISTSVGA